MKNERVCESDENRDGHSVGGAARALGGKSAAGRAASWSRTDPERVRWSGWRDVKARTWCVSADIDAQWSIFQPEGNIG